MTITIKTTNLHTVGIHIYQNNEKAVVYSFTTLAKALRALPELAAVKEAIKP